jgi:hypothetical protein
MGDFDCPVHYARNWTDHDRVSPSDPSDPPVHGGSRGGECVMTLQGRRRAHLLRQRLHAAAARAAGGSAHDPSIATYRAAYRAHATYLLIHAPVSSDVAASSDCGENALI